MRRANPRIIGLFVVVSVATAVAGITVFGSGRLFSETQKYVIFFDGSLAGLNEGAPVKFRGVKIGVVDDVLFNLFGTTPEMDLRLPVIIELEKQLMVARGADIDLGDPGLIDSMITVAGIRGQLAVESFVTGRRYIELGEHPETPYRLRNDPSISYPELPSITPFGFEDITADAQQLLTKLIAVDLGGLVQRLSDIADDVSAITGEAKVVAALDSLPAVFGNLNATLARFSALAEKIDTIVVPLQRDVNSSLDDAGVAMEEMRATFESLHALVAPGSPLTVRLEQALMEFAGAARSLRNLTEYLQQNPSAIVRGKPEEKR